MKKMRLGAKMFALNFIAMCVIHIGSYLKMSFVDIVKSILWDCAVESLIFATLFTLIIGRISQSMSRSDKVDK